MTNQARISVDQIRSVVAAVAVFSLLFLFVADGPRAQESPNDDLLTCDAIADERERLKCFNDIVNALRRQMEGLPPAPSRADDGEGMATRGEDREQDSVASADRGSTVGSSRRASPEDLDNFGFPDLDRNRITLVSGVNRFWYTTYDKKLVLELTNGQIWMETKGSSYRARPRERAVDPHTLTVEIKEGRIGGYRLKIQGKKGFARVRRLR